MRAKRVKIQGRKLNQPKRYAFHEEAEAPTTSTAKNFYGKIFLTSRVDYLLKILYI